MKDETTALIVIIISLIALLVCLYIPKLYVEPKQTYPLIAIDLTEDFGAMTIRDPRPRRIKK